IILENVGDLQTRLRIYNDICQYTSLQDDSSILWTASTYTYYVRIEALVSSTSTVQSVVYRLDVDWIEPSPTATPTRTPTPTPPPSITEGDEYEVNDLYTDAFTLPVTTYLELGNYLGVANFYPANENDWYAFWGKDGKWYQITTSELSGVDTYLQIYRQNGTTRITRNDDGGGGYASLASFEADYTGYHYILVTNKATGDATGTYNMTVEEIGEPEPQSTNTPGPGPDSKADSCEENADFGTACVIAADDPKTFNFAPPYGGVDNDFFKLWIKPGYNYECSTSYLDAGVDPNMIVFTGPSWDNAIGGNDDVEPGDLNSYFAYYAAYEGWLYILVGYGDRTPSDIYNSNYTLECKMTTPGSPTAVPTLSTTSTPKPTTNVLPTATPFEGLTIRQLTTPTPIPESPSEPGFVMVNLLVYYDANGDSQPGAGEGVKDIAVQAYDVRTGELLAQGITDELGHIEFTVTAQGPVRVTVPFFGFSQIVAGEEAVIRLRVPSRPLSEGGP
ncbi:MAG: PPC domain-containing protein, partial [Anaerolineae bacterium]